ncbi:NADH-quinone oxidoreductase subunit NuoG [Telmatobacter bradus]|uniref:NADH-quinone oxidoreductase subunit NuoG n=1 Tax=Telmatobacter bradus TaxID=474953 RepID=UPI003B436E5D
MADVTFTVDGKLLTAPAGTLLIEACRKAGIEIPAFCYYPGLSLQAACRMCLVRQEKVPKLQTACTTTVAEGQVFFTDTEEIHQSRKAMLQLLLGNHPLDCPVCDAGGECELQDMTFKYGAGESLYENAKNHREEQQWSPAVFYDRPRCILCYRCVRVCGEGMDVWALGIQNRGSSAVIAPNNVDQLDCEQCGQCIDICPVGALTSGSYRYKTRPWEMNHVSTVCTHCGDGCKVTLGVRATSEGAEIIRADNRDKSGLNGDFLCARGRFGFDLVHSEERLTTPLVRNSEGKLEASTWEQALRTAGARLKEIRDTKGGAALGVVGSKRSTNEENFLLQKLARTVLGTSNIDHERTTDYAVFAAALAGNSDRTASLKDLEAPAAVLLVGADPTMEHPLTAWMLRTAVRLHRTRLYIANPQPIKLDRQAKLTLRLAAGEDLAKLLAGEAEFSRAVREEESLVVILGPQCGSEAIRSLVAWGVQKPGVRFALLGDEVNARGAADMGIASDLLPGYKPAAPPGKTLASMVESAAKDEIAALLLVGANPAAVPGFDSAALKKTFLVVTDSFLTETAALADVVLPAATLYEKSGTVTNSYGDVQRVNKGADLPGIKPDFEIMVRLAGAMGADVKTLVPFGKGASADLGQSRGAQAGEADRHAVYLEANGLEPRLSPFDPLAILDEIAQAVPGYALDRIQLLTGNAEHAETVAPENFVPSNFVPIEALMGVEEPAVKVVAQFSAGPLGRHSKALKALEEHQEKTHKTAQH